MIPYLILALVGVLIVLCHILAAFGSERRSLVGVCVGLTLHVPLLLLLLYVSASMEVAIAAFLGSALLYTALSLIAARRREATEEGGDAA